MSRLLSLTCLLLLSGVQVRKSLLDGVAEDERGPASFAPMQPVVQDSADLDVNLARASELLDGFVTDVLSGLVDVSGDPKRPRKIMYNVKGRQRAFDKVRYDYGGDGARVTDLLRGCVICDNTIAEVCARMHAPCSTP